MDMVLRIKRLPALLKYGKLESFDVEVQFQRIVLIQVAHDALKPVKPLVYLLCTLHITVRLGERSRGFEVDKVL